MTVYRCEKCGSPLTANRFMFDITICETCEIESQGED